MVRRTAKVGAPIDRLFGLACFPELRVVRADRLHTHQEDGSALLTGPPPTLVSLAHATTVTGLSPHRRHTRVSATRHEPVSLCAADEGVGPPAAGTDTARSASESHDQTHQLRSQRRRGHPDIGSRISLSAADEGNRGPGKGRL